MRIVAFHGGKGGVGTTMLAAEASAVLARAGLKVAAIDIDLYRGDLHYRLDVPVSRGTYTITDLLPVLGEIDGCILDNALSTCPCLARLLPAPALPGDAELVDKDHVLRLLQATAGEFDHVIVDTPPSLDDRTLAALCLSDLLVLVVTPELSCLGGARRALDAINANCIEARHFALVVNRSLGEADLLTLGEIESFLELPAVLVLPEDAARCRRTADEGRLLTSERSPLGQGISAMVRSLFPP